MSNCARPFNLSLFYWPCDLRCPSASQCLEWQHIQMILANKVTRGKALEQAHPLVLAWYEFMWTPTCVQRSPR